MADCSDELIDHLPVLTSCGKYRESISKIIPENRPPKLKSTTSCGTYLF
jgi:hypothetical protein